MSGKVRSVILATIVAMFIQYPSATVFGAMRIMLKDGTSLSVPVLKEDVVSIHFDAEPASSGMKNYALAANGGQVLSGFTGWSTPRSLIIDSDKGPDDPNPNSTTRDGIAAYSVVSEPFKVAFSQPITVKRIGIKHKYGGGGGARNTIERARIVFDNGISQEIRFEQTYDMQYVDVYPTVSGSLTVEPISFYNKSDGRWGVIEFEVLGTAAR